MPSPPSPSGSPVRLLPLGPAPFAVWLLRAEGGEASGDPFLRAGAGKGGNRAYLALLKSETGAVVDRLLVELPGDDPGEAPFPGDDPLANAAVEAEWAAAHRDLLRLLAAPAHFPELVLPAEAGPGGYLPPTVFSPATGRLYRIPCPRCFAALRTCRDDARLAAAGLPLYSSTAARFLHCPSCPPAGEEERFYAGSPAEARGLGERVGTLEDLRRELAGASGREPAGEDLPPSGWTVFNLHDSPWLATRLASLSFDELLARLGGGGAEERAGGGFLFAAEGSGIDAVEVLALKLAVFVQAVSALRRHYLLLGRPHLDLHPDHLRAEPGPPADGLPSLWSFQVKLLGASSAQPASLGPGIEVPLPPRNPRAPYASSAIRTSRLATPSLAELLVERVVAEKGGWDLYRLEGTLLDPHGFFPAPAPRDWVQLAWPRDLLGAGRSTAARLDPRVAPQSVEIAITTEPVELDPALAQRLGRPGGFRVPGVRYKIYPALSAPEDLYSLGLLLLRVLLVNDGQALSALEPLVEAVPQGAGQEIRGARRSLESVDEALSAMLAAEPEKLSKTNIFHRAVERAPGRPNSIPDEIWTEALLFALRLVARGPGFGLTPERGGSFAYNETYPVAHLDEVRTQAEDLLRRLYALLFHRQAVHVEIQSVLAELLADEGGRDETRQAPPRVPTDRVRA
jgi:hypothetical protein